MIKLGIVMDPISAINIKKDTSFGMLLEAQKRGYDIHYMEMKDLFLEGGLAKANTRSLSVESNPEGWYRFEKEQTILLGDLDVILMRKDPPFDTEFVYATYLLELAENLGTLIVNKPQSLRDCNEKLFTAWFPDVAATTLVTRNDRQIRDFHQKHKDIILKPLDGMGGASIFRVKEDGNNLGVIIETLTNHGNQFAMVQSFIPEISEGDKRILLIDGEPIPYCLARLPAKGETRGNLAAGGTGRAQELSESDLQIARRIGPELKKRGLIWVGLDVIGDKVTEINVTSPTCAREIEAAFDIKIFKQLFDCIESKIN